MSRSHGALAVETRRRVSTCVQTLLFNRRVYYEQAYTSQQSIARLRDTMDCGWTSEALGSMSSRPAVRGLVECQG